MFNPTLRFGSAEVYLLDAEGRRNFSIHLKADERNTLTVGKQTFQSPWANVTTEQLQELDKPTKAHFHDTEPSVLKAFLMLMLRTTGFNPAQMQSVNTLFKYCLGIQKTKAPASPALPTELNITLLLGINEPAKPESPDTGKGPIKNMRKIINKALWQECWTNFHPGEAPPA